MNKQLRILHFPISFFSIILGLTGATLAFQKAEQVLKIPVSLSSIFLIVTVIIFSAITIIYAIKYFTFRDEVIEEFNNPIKLSFFPTFSISFVMLSIATLGINESLSKYLWVVGTVLHFIFTLKIISIWIHHTHFEIKHMNPAWFIPAVGNILVPIAGVKHFSPEISWFFFSIGLFFWIILLIIFFNRIIFHHPLPEKLVPTLFILIAPPAVGFIAYVKLVGEVDAFARILFYFALFLTFLLFFQVKSFAQIKFYFSWWAYSFPISAITIATILMYHQTEVIAFKYLAFVFLAILSTVVLFLILRTAKAIKMKEICVEE
ncbi:MAG: SLAC1 anion channel family protein [Melioribacteraceae bacterium]